MGFFKKLDIKVFSIIGLVIIDFVLLNIRRKDALLFSLSSYNTELITSSRYYNTKSDNFCILISLYYIYSLRYLNIAGFAAMRIFVA